MAKTWEYGKGDTVVYLTFGGGERTVKVTARLADVKGGKPGFDGTIMGGEEYTVDEGLTAWGYDEQIVKVIHTSGK